MWLFLLSVSIFSILSVLLCDVVYFLCVSVISRAVIRFVMCSRLFGCYASVYSASVAFVAVGLRLC